MLVNYLIDTNVFAVYSFEKKNRNHCIALVILFVLSSVCILFFGRMTICMTHVAMLYQFAG